MEMIKDVKLVKVEAFQDFGCWYMYLVYEYEDQKGKHRQIYPKVNFPISQFGLPIINYITDPCTSDRGAYMRCVASTRLYKGLPTSSDMAYAKHAHSSDWVSATVFDILTEEAVHEMTLEDIEEKLGYKVKVVSKKEDE